MDAYTRLNESVNARIAREEDFKREIMQQIDGIIRALAECPRTELSPAAASTLDLSQEQLSEVLQKLNNLSNMDSTQVTSITDLVKNANLRRGPVPSGSDLQDLTRPAAPAPAAPAPPVAPAPVAPAPPAAPRSYASVAAKPAPKPPSLLDRVAAASMGGPSPGPKRGGLRTRRRRKTRR